MIKLRLAEGLNLLLCSDMTKLGKVGELNLLLCSDMTKLGKVGELERGKTPLPEDKTTQKVWWGMGSDPLKR